MEGEGKMMGGTMGGGMMKMCNCPHHKVIPLMIFLIGLFFLLSALNVITMMMLGWLWPIAVMVIGIMKMMRGSCKCCGGQRGGMC